MSSYFENRKTISFYVLCLNFSMETKIKALFLTSHFNLSKKTKCHFRYPSFFQMENINRKKQNIHTLDNDFKKPENLNCHY